MRKALNVVLLLLLVCGVLFGMSYLGARATAGKLVGNNPPLFGRTISFNYRGVSSLPGRPRAWVIAYSGTRLPGVRSAAIYVSLKGDIIATVPGNLDARLDAYEKSQEP